MGDDDSKLISIRLDARLAEMVRAVADAGGRTMTSQVERLIAASLEPDEMTWAQWVALMRADGAMIPDDPSEEDLLPDTLFFRKGNVFYTLDTSRMVLAKRPTT